MDSWQNVGADLCIVDPPFGIDFSGKKSNYNRDNSTVVDGYVEWDKNEYAQNIKTLLKTIKKNIKNSGQALIFSGIDNSHIIHSEILSSELTFEGKMYWAYNFAPYCSRRPAHNVYEIFWVTNTERHYYNNECSHDHCQNGEANLSMMKINRDYHKDIPKYDTRLPEKVISVLLDHFTQEGDKVFDPCAGSGMVGVVSELKNRQYVCGDINENAKNVYRAIREMYNLTE